MYSILFAVLLSLVAAKEKLVFKKDGTFKILHISDVHYEVPSIFCDDILLSQLPCDEKNSTELLSWLIETEKPDLIVHTGDIIDWATIPATKGMTEYYNVSYSHNVPWAASLGNN
jgi:predicted MPP superfamily phosphohydrolase